jgi:DNA-directed RNA polymerase I, II, and III subunit RPABC2
MDEIDDFPMSDSEVEISSDIEDDGPLPTTKKNKKIVDDDADADVDSDDNDDELDSDIDDDDDDEFDQFDDNNDENMESMLQNTRQNDNSGFAELDDFSDEESDNEDYLQKINENAKDSIVADYHPELLSHNHDEVEAMCKITRDQDGVIVDPLHITLPFLTKYEKARIVGERSKQINAGAQPFVDTDPSVIDGYLIALKELEEKKLPFIIKRPMPNGGCEYWRLEDLEIIA